MLNSKRTQTSAFYFVALSVCALLTIAGCGPAGVPTYAVTGTVLVDGKPVEQGDIFFFPADGRVAPEGCRIVDGKYALRAKAGKNRIEITALDLGPDTVYIDGVPLTKNYLPPRFNTESELEREVAPNNANRIDFDLSTTEDRS